MIKEKAGLFKKTLVWRHLSKGIDAISFPAEVKKSNIEHFKLYGKTVISDSGSMESVGDYDSESEKYLMKLHIHGKNYMSGDTFAEIFTASGASKTNTIESGGSFLTKPTISTNGTVVINRSHIRFNEKTAYTIATQIRMLHSGPTRDFRLRFDYSDGTSYFPKIESNTILLKGCVSSDPEKTLVSLSSYTEADLNIRFILKWFGIYEGTHTSFNDTYEAYSGTWVDVKLNAPLMSIGYTSDELDMLTGQVTRKIATQRIDSSVQCAASSTEGVYIIMLDHPMRPGSKFISPYPDFDAGEETGIRVSEDGRMIYLKLPESVTIDNLLEYLENNPFDITYVLKTPLTETVSLPTLILKNESVIEIFTNVAPRKVVAVYV